MSEISNIPTTIEMFLEGKININDYYLIDKYRDRLLKNPECEKSPGLKELIESKAQEMKIALHVKEQYDAGFVEEDLYQAYASGQIPHHLMNDMVTVDIRRGPERSKIEESLDRLPAKSYSLIQQSEMEQ